MIFNFLNYRELVSTKTIPSTFPTHETLLDDEVQAFLGQRQPEELGPNWMLLLLTVINCYELQQYKI